MNDTNSIETITETFTVGSSSETPHSVSPTFSMLSQIVYARGHGRFAKLDEGCPVCGGLVVVGYRGGHDSTASCQKCDWFFRFAPSSGNSPRLPQDASDAKAAGIGSERP